MYQNLGFDHFLSQKDYPDQQEIGMTLSDKQLLTTSIEHTETLKEPYFSFLVAMTSHMPYEIPKDKRELDLSGYEDPMLKRYYYYVDEPIGQMVSKKHVERDTCHILRGSRQRLDERRR